MAEYVYDGTFEGFLCCVYEHYHREKAEAIYPKEEFRQLSLLTSPIEVRSDAEKAEVVYHANAEKISDFDLRRAYRIFLAEVPRKEMILLNYLRFGFIKGKDVSGYHGIKMVRDAEILEKNVTFEAHRLAGLLRFSVLDGGVLYAEISPDHRVLELLAPHFSDRYRNDPFIIHDVKRGEAIAASGGQWYLTTFSPEELPGYCKDEREYRKLWKRYFETTAIRERTNPRCQKSFMPVRYWKHLTELSEEYHF